MNNYIKNESLIPMAIYEPIAKIMVTTSIHVDLRYTSLEFFGPFLTTNSFNSRNCEARPNRMPKIPTYIVKPTAEISEPSLLGIVSRAFNRLPSKITPPALIPIIDFVSALAALWICVSRSLEVSMERFSFQGMVKGWQLERCLAILGETLRPIPASRIYGGSV